MQLAMPITHFNILVAKFAGVYFLNLLFSLMIMLPNCVMYFLYTGFNAGVFIMFFISIFLIPLIPCILGSALSALITYMLRKFQHKNYLTLVFTLIFFYFYFQFFGNIQESIIYISESADKMFSSVTSFYFPALLFFKTVSGDVLYFLIFTILSLLPVFVLLWVLAPLYSKLVSAANQTFVKSDFKFTAQKKSSRTAAMIKKEVSMFFSSAIYVMNTIFMLVLLTGGSVYAIISKDNFLQALDMIPGLGNIDEILLGVALAALLMMSAMSSTTAPAISLEGNRLWIYKSSPVCATEIFNAKILVSMFAGVPLIIINAIMYTLTFSFDIVGLLLLIIIPSVAIYATAQLGLIFNLLLPKLDWKNEAMVIKNSASTIFALLSYMILSGIVLFIGYMIMNVSNINIAAASVLAILCVFVFIFNLILKTYGAKKFESLTVNS